MVGAKTAKDTIVTYLLVVGEDHKNNSKSKFKVDIKKELKKISNKGLLLEMIY